MNNFLILGDHIGAHNGNATAAAAATPVKVASPPPLAVSPPPLAVSPPPVEAPKAASPPPTQPSPAPLAAVAQVKTAAEASGIVQGGSAQPSPAAAELEQPFHAAAGDSVIIPRKALKPGVEGSHAFRIGGLFGAGTRTEIAQSGVHSVQSSCYSLSEAPLLRSERGFCWFVSRARCRGLGHGGRGCVPGDRGGDAQRGLGPAAEPAQLAQGSGPRARVMTVVGL